MISIIYSSIGGNTQLVTLKVAEVLTEMNIQTEVKHFSQIDPDSYPQTKLTILASPTYNQGTLDKEFEKFIHKFAPKNIHDANFGVIGLGDTKYYSEYLTESVGILETWIKNNSGNLVINSLRINGLPAKYLETLVLKWAQKVGAWYQQN